MQKALSQAGLMLTLLCSGATVQAQGPSVACTIPIAYAVDDHLLRQAIGGDLQTPKSPPAFQGGNSALKAWFDAHPLTDPRAASMIVRVHVGFTVNYKGEAGDFRIISTGTGVLAELAQELLKIAETLPQSWIPAKAKRAAVDCYQVLSFTIRAGAYGIVSLKS